jgi:RNA polymerase sigma-54 factor
MYLFAVALLTVDSCIPTASAIIFNFRGFNPLMPETKKLSWYSSELIRQKIKQFVANEGENVLSDDKIGTILRGEGVDIARRTVAKYRTAMSIPSFFERRKKLSSHGRL